MKYTNDENIKIIKGENLTTVFLSLSSAQLQ